MNKKWLKWNFKKWNFELWFSTSMLSTKYFQEYVFQEFIWPFGHNRRQFSNDKANSTWSNENENWKKTGSDFKKNKRFNAVVSSFFVFWTKISKYFSFVILLLSYIQWIQWMKIFKETKVLLLNEQIPPHRKPTVTLRQPNFLRP